MGARGHYSIGLAGIDRADAGGHVGHRHHLLGAVGQAAQGDGAPLQLALADDGGVGDAQGVGLAHLGLEGALAAGGQSGDALSPQVGGEAKGVRTGGRRLEGDEDLDLLGRRDRLTLSLQVNDDPLHAAAEADARRGPASQLLDEAVVAAAAADAALSPSSDGWTSKTVRE